MRDRIAWWRPAGEDERQVRERFFLPPRHVRDDVSHRPGARHARLHQLRVREARVGRLEGLPSVFEPLQELLLTHWGESPPARVGAPLTPGAAGDHGACRTGEIYAR